MADGMPIQPKCVCGVWCCVRIAFTDFQFFYLLLFLVWLSIHSNSIFFSDVNVGEIDRHWVSEWDGGECPSELVMRKWIRSKWPSRRGRAIQPKMGIDAILPAEKNIFLPIFSFIFPFFCYLGFFATCQYRREWGVNRGRTLCFLRRSHAPNNRINWISNRRQRCRCRVCVVPHSILSLSSSSMVDAQP